MGIVILEKLEVISPAQALERYGSEDAPLYLFKMLEQMSDGDAAHYFAEFHYNGDLDAGWRELERRRHRALFAR